MTAANTVAYTFGFKDEVQGSGVFSTLQLKNNLKDRAIGTSITGLLVAVFIVTAQSKGYI